jgi:hypothetical protein
MALDNSWGVMAALNFMSAYFRPVAKNLESDNEPLFCTDIRAKWYFVFQ